MLRFLRFFFLDRNINYILQNQRKDFHLTMGSTNFFIQLLVVALFMVVYVKSAQNPYNPRLSNGQVGIRIKGHGVNRHILPRNNGHHVEL